MTDDENATVPDADPAAVLAIAAELAANQAQRDAAEIDARAQKRATVLAKMASMLAMAGEGTAQYRADRAAARAQREADRQAARAQKAAELAELKAKLAAIPRPDRHRRPGIPLYIPKIWNTSQINAAVRAMLALCSEQPAAYELARAVQDAIIEAYPAETPTGPHSRGIHDMQWSGPIVQGPRPPDPDPED